VVGVVAAELPAELAELMTDERLAERLLNPEERDPVADERPELRDPLADPRASVALAEPVLKMVVEPIVEVIVDPSVVMVVKIGSVEMAVAPAPKA